MANRMKGNQSTFSKEKQMALKVMDLFHIDEIMALRIHNYHLRTNQQKQLLCDLFRPMTLCKLPAPDNRNDLIFYLRKEERV